MRLTERLTQDDKYLQRYIGLIAGSGSIIIGFLNYLGLRAELSVGTFDAAGNPIFWFLVLTGMMWIATGYVSGTIARLVQIALFAAQALITALSANPGNITSAMFLIFTGVLIVEYYRHKRAALVAMIGLSLAFAVALTMGYRTFITGSLVWTAGSLVLVATGAGLYGVVLLRHWLQHRNEAELLESRVHSRTAELEKALDERVVMLQEIHHRVKNNLQIVASLLRLETNKLDSDTARRPMETSIQRIHAMALVHETLYQSEQLEHVDLDRYTRELLAAITATLGSNIQLDLDCASDIQVDLDFAVPFGLLLNELITNAVEHAFEPEQKGHIEVAVRQQPELELVVKDDGIGLPEATKSGGQRNLGLTLVHSLVQQLHGEIEVENDSGTRWTVTIPPLAHGRIAAAEC